MKKQILLALWFVLLSAGCDLDAKKLKYFKGIYQDPVSGARLELGKGRRATFTSQTSQLDVKLAETSFDTLLKGQPGFYLNHGTQTAQAVDVYWITPKADTLHEFDGFVSFNAELIYFKLDRQVNEVVTSIHLIHATEGQVMLDLQNKTWQAGWAPGPEEMEMVRAR